MSNVKILGEAKLKRYVVLAHRRGEFRLMLKYFPVSDSADEAMQRVFAKSIRDPEWAKRYRGWAFVPAEAGNSVIIGNDGIVRRCS